MKIKLLFLFLLTAGTLFAQPADKASEILKATQAFYQKTADLQVDTLFNLEISAPGMPEPMKEKIAQKVSLKRPGQFALTTIGDTDEIPNVYLNNKTGTIKIADAYIQEKGLQDLKSFFLSKSLGYSAENKMHMLIDQNVAVHFLKILLVDFGDKEWANAIAKSKYQGEEEIDGQKTHHIVVYEKSQMMGTPLDLPVHIWIAQGEQPLLVKVMPDLNGALKNMNNPHAAQANYNVTASYANWKINKGLDDSTFNIAVPKGTDVHPSLEAFFTEMQKENDPGASLTGKAAADFEVTLLDGKTFKLSEQKGKHIVVLDFWATWCGPCVKALPILVETTAALKDKGVILIAMNQAENADTINTFLEKKNLQGLTVGLDKGKIAQSYKVRGIPQTVIIGKDGLVKQVHVGFAPNLGEQLKKELEALIAE